jgi:transcriptional regulator with XRE-family HTH domain
VSIGDTLADARRQAGLTITQVSQQTRIRESIIRSIEQGDFSPCGGDFYARGHIRSIAAVVGVDPGPLIREYDEEHGPPGSMRASQIFEPATPIKIREPRNFHFRSVLAVVVLAAAGFGAYHLYENRSPHSSADATDTLRPAATATAKAHPSVSPTPVTHTSTAPAKPETVIRLTALQACWIGFNSPAGKSISQVTVQAGQTMTWHELNPVSMVIGNPPGIELSVNGKAEPLNTVQVVTLSINPFSQTPVTIG